ncbi:MAG: hypothetical protein JNL98_00515 [Bryobacterales bacterium]|nr:hypothetical protein [Bryobacterales bacterium]
MRTVLILITCAVLAYSGGVKLKPLTPEEQATLKSPGSPAVAGVHRPLPPDAMKKGKWKKLPDGKQQWRLEVHSPGAQALRVQFEDFDTGAAGVRVCEKEAKRCYGPYSGKGPMQDRTFWSDTVDGSTLLVEYTAAARAASLPFRASKLSHQK